MLKYKLRRISKSKLIVWSTLILLFFVSIGSIVNYYATSVDMINATESKIDGDTVYVNDFTSDYNYYMGLNYTEVNSSDDPMPGNDNTNKYNDNTLLKVQLTYDGHDINDGNLFGYVSNEERQSRYVYYKYYPIDNDGKVKIELIDNPYSARPEGFGFNGWVCDNSNIENAIPCEDMIFTYDDDYYTRYLIIDTTNMSSKKAIINLKASWIAAKIYQPSGKWPSRKTFNFSGNLNEKSMMPAINSNNGSFYNHESNNFDEFSSMVGYFYKINNDEEFNSTQKELLYTQKGKSCAFSQCSVSSGVYKLIQSNDKYSNPFIKDDSGNIILKEGISKENYYYFVTRDTNIIDLENVTELRINNLLNNSATVRPYTVTSSYSKEKENTASTILFATAETLTIKDDIVLENLTFTDENINNMSEQTKKEYSIHSNGHNLKIGRNVSSYDSNHFVFNDVYSSSSTSSSTNLKGKVVVESGHYNMLVAGPANNVVLKNPSLVSQYGSDYDRVTGNNSNLVVNFSVQSGSGGKTISDYSNNIIIKSGTYGDKSNITSDTYYTYGVYANSSSSNGSTYLSKLKIEGGKIFNINGGIDVDSSYEKKNAVGIYVTGGEIENIVGGGAINATYGNRIISVTGGTIYNSVAGGSNSSSATHNDSNAGPLKGSTLVYVGGDATMGKDGFSSIYGVSKVGSVFGAGLGTNENSNTGSVTNSNVIINLTTGVIKGDVYGGGNYGAVGGNSYFKDAKTQITVLNGYIMGDVFGAANNNGFSYEDTQKLNEVNNSINIDLKGGTIDGTVYGGSNSNGKTFGTININATGTEISGGIYGAGYGEQTQSVGKINITVDKGNVEKIYGGSSLGLVGVEGNLDRVYDNFIMINGGTINEVYGGSEGSFSIDNDPIVNANVKVIVNGGNIQKVYGGNNIKGFVRYRTEVNVTNGKVETLYGGSHGENAKSNDTIVNILGGEINTIYGGGEEAPAISSNITIAGSAVVNNVFGGSNHAGLVNNSNVVANGGEVRCNIYGGGQEAPVISSNIEINNVNFISNVGLDGRAEDLECGNIFGGGKSANVESSNIMFNGGNVSNIYGGSNEDGLVQQAKINVNNGAIANVFGGNNRGGSTDNTEINIMNGQISGDVYGGGNKAPVYQSTLINMYGGTAQNVYGGGNNSYIGKALVSENGTLIANTNNNTIDYVPGSTEVNIINGVVNNNVYGSGNTSFVYGNTVLNIGSSAIKDESYSGNKNISIMGSIFGGSETNANEDDKYKYDSIGVSGNATVNIDGSNYVLDDVFTIRINGSIYGSGNNSNTTGDKLLKIDNFGTENSLVTSLSIQRFDRAYIKDSNMELSGDRDRESGTTFIYSIIRIGKLYVLGSDNDGVLTGTDLYVKSGSTYLKEWFSGALNGDEFVPQETVENGNNLVNKNSNNKLYMFTNKLLSVSDSDVPDRESSINPGRISGMSFLGMYSITRDGEYKKGIYNEYNTGDIIDKARNEEISSVDYTYVFGARNREQTYQEQIKTNGFYTNVSIGSSNSDEYVIRRRYVDVTPKNDTTNYYEWRIGDVPPEIDVPLIATRYSVDGVNNASLSIDALREKIGEEDLEWQDATMEIFEVKTDDFKAESPNVINPYDLYLVDKSQINTYNLENVDADSDKIGNSVVDANQYFALSMGTTSSGWIDNYSTNIYNEGFTTKDGNDIYGEDFCTVGEGGDCVGNNMYIYDSTRNQRSLTFWLHHSKNLDFSVAGITDSEIISVPLGKVVVYAKFTNPHADPTDAKGSVVVSINVNISMQEGEQDAYGASIAPGKKYDVFQTLTPALTTDSSFSIYQSLYLDMNAPKLGNTQGETWSVEEVYGEGNYRALRSSYNFPVGTRITMLDLSSKEQYFYDVDGSNHKFSDEYYQYKLSEFYKMGNSLKNIKYDDDMNGRNSKKYYHVENVGGKTLEIGTEEFIFFVDFSNVKDENHKNQNDTSYYLSMVLSDKDGKAILSTKFNPQANMVYKLFSYTDIDLRTDGGFLDGNKVKKEASIYSKQNIDLQLDTKLKVLNNGVESIATTTTLDEYKLGANIKIYRGIINEDGSVDYEDIPENDNLLGLVLAVNGEYFYPQKDHSIRVKLAGRVTGLNSVVNFDFSNSNMEPGKYKIEVETFASYDGLYYGDMDVSKSIYELTLLNDDYGLDVSFEDNLQMTHDVNNGLDKNGNNVITYNIQTKNGLINPNLKISLQRKIDDSYSLEYEEKDLKDIVTGFSFNGIEINDLDSVCYSRNGNVCNKYDIGAVDKNITIQNSVLRLTLKNGPSEEDLSNPSNSTWKSGTYRVVLTMYDGDTPIGSVYEYLIIRSLGIDENIERSGS